MKKWETKGGSRITRVLAGRSNVFLISMGDRHILVDTGPARGWKKLDRRLKKLGLECLDAVILTHAHYDHAGNAAKLQDKYGAKVIAHIAEGPFLAKGENIVTKGTSALPRLLIAFLGKRFAQRVGYEPCRSDIQIDPAYDLREFGFKASVLHTPGHSPGSLSVIVDDEIALVGDAMFGIFPGSIFPPFAADGAQMIKSWGKLLATKCRLFLPAHGSANSRQLVVRDYHKRSAQAHKQNHR